MTRGSRGPAAAWVALLLAMTVAVTGCAQTGRSPAATDPSPATAAGHSVIRSTANPSASAVPGVAAMICGPEVRTRLRTVLDLAEPPHGTSTWTGDTFVCTYRLPDGDLRLAVHVTSSNAKARLLLATQRRQTRGSQPIAGLAGLGLPSYQNPAGTVGFAKDSFTFTSDASAMQRRIGPDGMTRTAFAYNIAAAVLACWSEHD